MLDWRVWRAEKPPPEKTETENDENRNKPLAKHAKRKHDRLARLANRKTEKTESEKNQMNSPAIILSDALPTYSELTEKCDELLRRHEANRLRNDRRNRRHAAAQTELLYAIRHLNNAIDAVIAQDISSK
jgi:uncharacterized membrane protein YccC